MELNNSNVEMLKQQHIEARKTFVAGIKYKLDIAGVTQSDIARQCNISVTAVNAVLFGRTQSPTLEKRVHDAIEKAIGEKIF